MFLDFVKGEFWTQNTENMVQFAMKEEWLQISYKEKTVIVTPSELWLEAKPQIKAEYMIEAVTN